MIPAILLGIIAVLLGIAVIRTFLIKAPSPGAKDAQFPQELLDDYAQTMGDMIRIPTVSKSEEEDLTQFYLYHEELERLFPLLHTHLEKTDLQGTLLYRWVGSDPSKKPILLMGHQDVVPASDDGWSVGAYSGEIKDGCVFGRGALDCKSTMFIEMQAVEELLAEGFVPPCDVYLEYSINEETGGAGAANAMQYLKDKGITLALVLDEGGAVIERAVDGMDRPYAVIGITEKGYMDLKITARGKGGHSSTPPRKTPAARLFAFANELERKRPFQKKLIPEAEEMFKAMAPSFNFPMRLVLGNMWLFKPLLIALMPVVSPFGEAVLATTCCFTMMRGSDAANVIPKEPYLVANLRTSSHQGCDATLAVMEKYAKKYDLHIEVLMRRDASPISNIHSKEYAYVTQCVKELFPDAGVAPYLIMGGTDCRHFHALTENALRFAPVPMTSAQSASCHAVDENVTITSLAEGVRFFKKFLKEYSL